MIDESGQRTEQHSGDAKAQQSDARQNSSARRRAFFTSVDASLLGLGSQMMSEVVAGVLLGYGLDYLLGTKNRWIVVGSIAGIAVAMVTVFRLALKQQPQRPARPGARHNTKVGIESADKPPQKAADSGSSTTEGSDT